MPHCKQTGAQLGIWLNTLKLGLKSFDCFCGLSSSSWRNMFQHAGTSKLLGKPKIGSKPPSQTILGNLLPWHTATGITQWVLPPAVCYACNHVNWLHGLNWPMDFKSWSRSKALELWFQPVACCHMSNSALVHWVFLASNLAYDWRTSASLVSTNWLYLVMLQCIWSSVVPLARTLGPLSPLLLQTCFWAAPSASSMEKVKWSLISWPSGPFNKKPVGG